jgi:zinc ribbon protein
MMCPTCGASNLANATFCSQCATRLVAPSMPVGGAYPNYGQNYALPSRGNTILVLGILSLTVCSILGPVAWSMGNEELRRIEAGQASSAGHQSANAGKICGMIASILLILAGVFILIAVVAAAGTSHHH